MMSELHQPGYLHVLLNHLPIIGTGMGVLAVIIGLLLRRHRAVIPGLALLVISGVSAWPVMVTGHQAYKPIMKIADDPGRDWLDEHMDRADEYAWVFYVMAGLAAVAIVVPLRWPGSTLPLGLVAVLGGLGGVVASGYIAQAGGPISHVEFRVPGQRVPSVDDLPK